MSAPLDESGMSREATAIVLEAKNLRETQPSLCETWSMLVLADPDDPQKPFEDVAKKKKVDWSLKDQ